MIRPFDLRRPSALGEVGALLGEYGDAAALYAGGTELLLLMKEGFVRPRVLVDVKRVPGLAGVTAAAGGIEIGATASHRSVERSEAVRAHAPLVAGVARHVANVRVRSVGTVGGNLAFADPHSDLATLFLVFDARVVLWSLAGERELPLADFVLGPYETARRDDEILTAVRLRPWPAGAAGTYLKFGVHERPTLGVAAVLTLDADRQTVADARLAIGCIGPRPERLGVLESTFVRRRDRRHRPRPHRRDRRRGGRDRHDHRPARRRRLQARDGPGLPPPRAPHRREPRHGRARRRALSPHGGRLAR